MRLLFSRILPCLGLVVVLGGGPSVSAQTGMRGPGPMIGGFHLIAMPAVQRELKMDETQVEKANAVAQRMKVRYDQDISKLKGLKPDEQKKRVVTLANPHYEEGMKQLRTFLKPEQVDRFDQILFQQRGPMAMLEPKIVQALQVTNQQAERIAQIASDDSNAKREVAQSTQGKPTPEGLAKFEEISTQTNAQAVEVLSPEQRKTWARIVGEPFHPSSQGNAAAGKSASDAPATETGAAPSLGKP